MATLNPCKLLKPNSRSAQKFNAIVEAAEQVFMQQGFQKASMDAIAKAAKVSKRTVYNHFETKDALFHHILENVCYQMMTSTELPYESSRPLDQQLTELLNIEWTLYASERFVKLARVVIGEYVNTPNFIENLIQDITEKESGLQKWLKAAIANKKIQDIDLVFASDFLSGSLKAFAHNPLMFDQPEPDSEEKAFIIGEIVKMFLLRYQV